MVRSNRAQIFWRKSRASGLNGCIEVARDDEHVLIRDSQNPSGDCLELTNEQWISFVIQAKRGVFDLFSS